MFYVFKSHTGQVSIGTEVLGRESVYSAPQYDIALRFAKALKTSHGATSVKETLLPADSLNSRGNVVNIRKDAYMSVSSLRITTTDHIPARRIA